MYIGQYVMYAVEDAWEKNDTRWVWLWEQGEENKLIPVKTVFYDPEDEENPNKLVQKTVLAMNAIGTIGYHPAASRYCSLVKINETYWVVGIECGG